MKAKNLMAIGMIAIMLATALSGCTGGEKTGTGDTGGIWNPWSNWGGLGVDSR